MHDLLRTLTLTVAFAAGVAPAAAEAGGVVREVRVHEGPDNYAVFRPGSVG